jgi:hypothetical protein
VLGRLPDPPDERDFLWRSAMIVTPISLPVSHRVSAMGPVLDQGQRPTCVPHTSASVKMHEEYREHRRYLDFDREKLYSLCKQIDGYPAAQGTTMRAACDVMTDPAKGIYAAARLQLDGRAVPITPDTYTISAYVRCQTLDEIKEATYADGPVALGMDIDTGWQKPSSDGTIAAPSGKLLGGHEITVCGYDDARAALWIKNSWGHLWAYYGYCWLPYSHLDAYKDWDAWRLTDQTIGPDA